MSTCIYWKRLVKHTSSEPPSDEEPLPLNIPPHLQGVLKLLAEAIRREMDALDQLIQQQADENLATDLANDYSLLASIFSSVIGNQQQKIDSLKQWYSSFPSYYYTILNLPTPSSTFIQTRSFSTGSFNNVCNVPIPVPEPLRRAILQHLPDLEGRKKTILWMQMMLH